jgi:hypothetical protein
LSPLGTVARQHETQPFLTAGQWRRWRSPARENRR